MRPADRRSVDVPRDITLTHPGPRVFPSNYTYRGNNLTWLELDEMPPADRAELERRDGRKRYADHVAGHLVLPTLDLARQFYRRLEPNVGTFGQPVRCVLLAQGHDRESTTLK